MNWIDLISWSDMIGYAGTGFTIMAYSVRRMLPLRVVAVLSSVALLVYGVLVASGPLIFMDWSSCRSTATGCSNC